MKTAPYTITHPRYAGQTVPDPVYIDGTAPDGTLQGDGKKAPFYVFDPNRQENMAGPFQSRKGAKVAARLYAKKYGLTVGN